MAPTTPRRANVVVSTRNSAGVITAALDALARQSVIGSLEVIVVDDGSTDDTPHVITRWIEQHPNIDIRVHRRERRGGPNAARNDGIRMSSSDLILLCDGDDVAEEHWAERLIDALEHHPNSNVIAGGHCVALGADDRPTDVFLYGRMSWGSISYALGGNCGFPRRLAEVVGGFDEQIRAGGTEVDFAMRVHDTVEVEIIDVPEAIIGYRLPVDRSGRVRRGFAKTRGRSYLARRYGHRPGFPSPWRTFVHPWRALAAVVRDRLLGRPLSLDLDTAIAHALGTLAWSALFAVRTPPPILGLAPTEKGGFLRAQSGRST